MKLLFDENLSRRLITRLADTFPDSAHITDAGLERASDRDVWEYARRHDYVLVSKDSDFNDLAFVHGAPPKVIWLRVGNASTNAIADLLTSGTDTIAAFTSDDQDVVLTFRSVSQPPDNAAR